MYRTYLNRCCKGSGLCTVLQLPNLLLDRQHIIHTLFTPRVKPRTTGEDIKYALTALHHTKFYPTYYTRIRSVVALGWSRPVESIHKTRRLASLAKPLLFGGRRSQQPNGL